MLNWLRRERGQDLVEFALVLPLLLLVVLSVVEFALLFFSYNTINEAARYAARWGVVVEAGFYRTAPDIEDKALEVTDAAGLSGVDPDATVDLTAKTVRVEVRYAMPLLNPIALVTGSPSIPLRAVSTKRIEVE
jgi:hypothetical protein